MMTLEELDNHKKGMSEVARNARQVSRVAGCADRRHARWRDRRRHLPVQARQQGGQAAACSSRPRCKIGALPQGLPVGKADNQILGSRARAAEQHAGARRRAGVERHQHAHQGARAGSAGRGILQRPGAGRHRPAVLRHLQLPDDFWDKHGKGMESWQENARQRLYLLPIDRAGGAVDAGQPVRLSRAEERRGGVLRPSSRRSTARPRSLPRCATTPTRRTMSGASPRAIASRTSRSTC